MRYVSIDVLRAVAIGLMVLVHFMENLAGADWAPAGLGAPIFTFLVGVSYRVWVLSQEAKGVSDEAITAISLRRGAFLFVLGFVFNVAVWLPDDTFNWDVLTLIGTALLVLAVLRNLPVAVPLCLGAAVFALGPLLRELTDYHSYWPDGYFDPDWDVADVLIGYVANGYFPLCPWLLYPLAGFVTATAFFTGDAEDAPPTGPAALVGLGLVALAATLVALRLFRPELLPVWFPKGWTMFPPSVEYVLGTLGGALLLFALAHRWLDTNPKFVHNSVIPGITKTFSQHSLSMYVLHHVVHLWPLWVYGWLTGASEVTHYWRRAVSVWVAIPLVFVYLGLSFALFRWMDRTGRKGIEGLMRRVCG